jgi:hypothetical protein
MFYSNYLEECLGNFKFLIDNSISIVVELIVLPAKIGIHPKKF